MSEFCARDSLFNRLRRSAIMRVLFICAAIVASQGSLACAIGDARNSQETETVSMQSTAGEADECCVLCYDCAGCGACCSSVTGARSIESLALSVCLAGARMSLTTSAPESRAPPSLLRPPIDAM
jgi:hypothetical protein